MRQEASGRARQRDSLTQGRETRRKDPAFERVKCSVDTFQTNAHAVLEFTVIRVDCDVSQLLGRDSVGTQGVSHRRGKCLFHSVSPFA
jgi:hypothetical protein